MGSLIDGGLPAFSLEEEEDHVLEPNQVCSVPLRPGLGWTETP